MWAAKRCRPQIDWSQCSLIMFPIHLFDCSIIIDSILSPIVVDIEILFSNITNIINMSVFLLKKGNEAYKCFACIHTYTVRYHASKVCPKNNFLSLSFIELKTKKRRSVITQSIRNCITSIKEEKSDWLLSFLLIPFKFKKITKSTTSYSLFLKFILSFCTIKKKVVCISCIVYY